MKAGTQAKIFVVAVLALLAVIIVLQNTAPVKAKILFYESETVSLAVMLLVTLGIGFVAGLITTGIWFARR